MSGYEQETVRGDRFEFGANWLRFLSVVDEARISSAAESLTGMLEVKSLSERTFLDAGSGSGLMSLAARRLGAKVHSFDYDPKSVACTMQLRRRYSPEDTQWKVEAGSVLDAAYLQRLGRFDVVYSWGVLHHTGNQALAMKNIGRSVAPNGLLFIALYNDQGWISKYWSFVKRHYNMHPYARPFLIGFHAPYLLAGRVIARALTGRLQTLRGMSLWYDMIDWLGGWPFEVSKPEEIIAFYASRGFVLKKSQTVGNSLGCNEFVFCNPVRS